MEYDRNNDEESEEKYLDEETAEDHVLAHFHLI